MSDLAGQMRDPAEFMHDFCGIRLGHMRIAFGEGARLLSASVWETRGRSRDPSDEMQVSGVQTAGRKPVKVAGLLDFWRKSRGICTTFTPNCRANARRILSDPCPVGDGDA